MRAPNTGRPAVGQGRPRLPHPPIPPAPPRRFALEESPAHVKHGPDRPRGASSPAHAAIHADAAAHSDPLHGAGAEKARGRRGIGRMGNADRRRRESTRRASSPAHAAYTPGRLAACCTLRPFRQRALKPHMPQPPAGRIQMTDTPQRTARAARHPPRTPPYMPMLPRTPAPFAPAGAEKAHAAADGSGTYQMADRRRSGKHARRVLPPCTPPYMPMLPRTPTPFAPAGAEKDRTATDGSRAHIKWPAAAAHKARAARPPPRTPPYMPMLPRTPTPFAPAGAENVRRSGKPARASSDRRARR